MTYQFRPDRFYRMPTHFGPSLGPRQGVDGRRYDCVDSPNDTVILATFNANKEQLEPLLPPGFTLRAPYTLTFDFSFITNIEWLAGRGYNTFGVSIPASYHGENETVHGDLLLVLWENKADPILTGRDDLGFAKLYCEIPEPQYLGDDVICRASWDGFEFASLRLKTIAPINIDQLPEGPEGCEPSQGSLHYKYIPKIGCPGEADAAYACLTPSDWPNMKIQAAHLANTAELNINAGTWEQLPTLIHITQVLAALDLGECSEAYITQAIGGKDLSDQRIIR